MRTFILFQQAVESQLSLFIHFICIKLLDSLRRNFYHFSFAMGEPFNGGKGIPESFEVKRDFVGQDEGGEVVVVFSVGGASFCVEVLIYL